MLKYVINKNKAVPSLRELDKSKLGFSYDESGENVLISGYKELGLMNGSVISFINTKCSGDTFVSRESKVLSLNTIGCYFECFKPVNLKVTSIEKITTRKSIDDAFGMRNFLRITLDEPEIYYDNGGACDMVVKECIYGDYTTKAPIRRCVGDYIVYNGIFLYAAEGVVDDKYVFTSGNTLNKTVDIIWKMKGRSEDVILTNVIVPVNNDGSNNMYELYLDSREGNNAAIIANILSNVESSYFFIKDVRFLTENCELTDGTDVYLNESFIKLGNIIEETPEDNLNKEDIVQSLFKKEKNDAKNSIFDYEKQIFFPVYHDESGVCYDLRDITFNLHLRERELDDDSWEVKKDGMWNNYKYIYYDGEKNELVPEPKSSGELQPSDADLVGYLGFDDDDIYYQKKKVSESFLRLCFYDSSDRRVQKLLMYSTIFMDAAKLYSDYVYKLSLSDALNSDNLVFDEGIVRLSTSFKCGSKYESEFPSEGFYLYLFPELLKSLPEPEDGDYRTIYMKVEFNNAKYGVTIPFTYPKSSDTVVPVCYTKSEESNTGITYVDMQSLFNDMYLPIKIRYDYDRKRYTWEIEGVKTEHAVLNVFEPRINCGGEIYKTVYAKPKTFYLQWNDKSMQSAEVFLHDCSGLTINTGGNVTDINTHPTDYGVILTFRANNNKDIGIETSTILLSCGDDTEKIELLQGEYTPHFNITDFIIDGVSQEIIENENSFVIPEFSYNRHTIQFTVVADIPFEDWTAGVTADWIITGTTTQWTGGTYDFTTYYKTYTYSMKPNAFGLRQGSVFFQYKGCDGKMIRKNVYCSQTSKSIIIIDSEGNEWNRSQLIELSAQEGRYFYTIYSNSDITVNSFNAFIVREGQTEVLLRAGENTLSLITNENVTSDEIIGSIQISGRRFVTYIYPFKQLASPFTLTIEPPLTILYNSGGHLKDYSTRVFNVNTKRDFSFNLTQSDWTRFSINSNAWQTNLTGKTNELIASMIGSNPGTGRTGSLTATATKSGVTASVTVNVIQDGIFNNHFRVFVSPSSSLTSFSTFTLTNNQPPSDWTEIQPTEDDFFIPVTYIDEKRYLIFVLVDERGTNPSIDILSARFSAGGGYYGQEIHNFFDTRVLTVTSSAIYYNPIHNVFTPDDTYPTTVKYLALDKLFDDNFNTDIRFIATDAAGSIILSKPILKLKIDIPE